jgi:hypothetical protein
MSIRTFRSTQEARKVLKLYSIQDIPHDLKRSFVEKWYGGYRKALVVTPIFYPRNFEESEFLSDRGFSVGFKGA